MKRCLKCSSLMPDDAARCIKCGFEVAAPQPAPVRASAAATAPVRPAAAKPAARAAKQAGRPGKIRGAWELAQQSWRVLMLDKQLLIFPLLSGAACLLVLATFIAGVFVTGSGGAKNSEDFDAVGWAMLFAYYFVNYFVIVFFNAALVACAMMRFQGGDPTVRDGLRAAGERIVIIAAWAAVAATVGVALRMIQERVALVGRIVIALLGAAWTIAAYFVVPVLVVEKLGPFDALHRSALIMKQTWGESLASNVGIGVVGFIATIVVFIVFGVGTAILWQVTGSNAVGLVCAAITVFAILLVFLVQSALETIVLSALYLYATEDKVPEAFEGTLEHAFVTK